MRKLLFVFIVGMANLTIGQTFNELLKVVANDRSMQDQFGYSVDISGNYAIIGAWSDDFSVADPNMGCAYIFEKEGIADWELVQKISASDRDDYDRFGWSVSIDGNFAVVGAYAEDHNLLDGDPQANAGAAYVFERNVAGTWNEVQKIIASDRTAGDEFGWSVSISGNTLVVGSHYDNEDEDGVAFIHHAGSAYIFDRIAGVWTQTDKLDGSGRAADIVFPGGGGGGDDLSDQFGCAVSISDDRLIIGAYHHDYNSVGAAPLSEAGIAYIFERSGGVWSEVAKIQSSDRAANDQFGYAVGIDGNFAIVGAFTEDENSVGGGTMTNAGSIYVFKRSLAGVWSQVQKIVPSDRAPGDRFGYSVSIDNSTIVVGAFQANTDESGGASLSNAGSAYTFSYDLGTDTWSLLNKIDASDRQSDDEFGVAVAVSGDEIIVGAHKQNFNTVGADDQLDAGAAYFFGQESCTPTYSSQTLTLCAGQTVTVGPYAHGETGVYEDLIFSVSGCDSIVTTNLTVTPAPSSSQEASICFGYAFEIGGSSHTESGVYVDTLTNLAGCDSLVTTTLTVSPENAVTHEKTICWGDSYTIGASTYTMSGIYVDAITSWALCDCTITTILTVQLPVDKSIAQTLSVLKAGADDATYQWIKCNPYEVLVGATNQTYIAPEVGEYAVIVTEGACTDTSSCVYVDYLGLEENSTELNFNIFPNPSNGTFTIQTNQLNSEGYKLVIQNILGETIKEQQLTNFITFVDLDNQPAGIYVIVITDGRSSYKTRLSMN